MKVLKTKMHNSTYNSLYANLFKCFTNKLEEVHYEYIILGSSFSGFSMIDGLTNKKFVYSIPQNSFAVIDKYLDYFPATHIPSQLNISIKSPKLCKSEICLVNKNISFYDDVIYKIDYDNKKIYGDKNIVYNYTNLILACGLESDFCKIANIERLISQNNNCVFNMKDYNSQQIEKIMTMNFKLFKNIYDKNKNLDNLLKKKKGDIVFSFGEINFSSFIESLTYLMGFKYSLDEKRGKINLRNILWFLNKRREENEKQYEIEKTKDKIEINNSFIENNTLNEFSQGKKIIKENIFTEFMKFLKVKCTNNIIFHFNLPFNNIEEMICELDMLPIHQRSTKIEFLLLLNKAIIELGDRFKINFYGELSSVESMNDEINKLRNLKENKNLNNITYLRFANEVSEDYIKGKINNNLISHKHTSSFSKINDNQYIEKINVNYDYLFFYPKTKTPDFLLRDSSIMNIKEQIQESNKYYSDTISDINNNSIKNRIEKEILDNINNYVDENGNNNMNSEILQKQEVLVTLKQNPYYLNFFDRVYVTGELTKNNHTHSILEIYSHNKKLSHFLQTLYYNSHSDTNSSNLMEIKPLNVFFYLIKDNKINVLDSSKCSDKQDEFNKSNPCKESTIFDTEILIKNIYCNSIGKTSNDISKLSKNIIKRCVKEINLTFFQEKILFIFNLYPYSSFYSKYFIKKVLKLRI